jgi:hypothetical protein
MWEGKCRPKISKKMQKIAAYEKKWEETHDEYSGIIILNNQR